MTAPLATAPQKEYGYRGGKLLIVWDGTQAGDDQLKWLVTDHLGSTRMLVNRSGGLCGGANERLGGAGPQGFRKVIKIACLQLPFYFLLYTFYSFVHPGKTVQTENE
ncbi:MAG: hypothetical protein AB7H86_13015 [Blastocatellales bacterium]